MKKNEANKNRAERLIVLQKVSAGEIFLHDAGREIGISYSQAKRIYVSYKKEGIDSLVHKNAGKRSNHRIDDSIRQKVLTLFREKYYDFGPTSAALFMHKKDGIIINHETLRRWITEDGITLQLDLIKPLIRRSMKRDCEGMLVRIRAVPCTWFSSNSTDCCIASIVDEATGTVLSLFYQGTILSTVLNALKRWLITHGIPEELYFENLPRFYKNDPNSEAQLFSAVCEKLGIGIIMPPRSMMIHGAYANKKLEYSHNLFEQRLRKELRVEQITAIDGAQKYLEDVFLPHFNKRFAHPARCSEKGSVPLHDISVVETILSDVRLSHEKTADMI